MKFFLLKPVVFGNMVQNPNQEPTKKGEEVFLDKQFAESQNLKTKKDMQTYIGSWAWFNNKRGHLASINFGDFAIKE